MTAGEVWAAGDAYEPYVGRWSRRVAREFLVWLALPADCVWLDLGCGTGALSQSILETCSPRRAVGVDASVGYLDYARQQVQDSRIGFQTGDAQALALPDDAFDIAVSGLVLNFLPDKARAVAEMRRVVRPGGTIALYVWDYAGQMQLMRFFWEAAAALDPEAKALDEGRRFPVCNPEPLRALFDDAGLAGIETNAIDVPTVFRDFDDYWVPFLGGQGPAPGYCMSRTLERREALRQRLLSTLPVQPDGSIPLMARAFAVRGTVPAS